MNVYQQEALETLRNAAVQDNWNLWREGLLKIIPHLNPTDAIKIVVKHARQFLSDLSRFHPEEENIKRAVEALNNITSLEELDHKGEIINPLLDEYWDWPGVSNFRNTFKGISKPHQYFEHSGEYVDTMRSIIMNILIANGANNYWGNNPEFSKTFFGPDVRKAVLMLAKHHSDPKQVAIRKSLWDEIIHDFEDALQAI